MNSFKEKEENFKKEFKELLKRYNADIFVETKKYTSIIIVDVDNREVLRSFDSLTFTDI